MSSPSQIPTTYYTKFNANMRLALNQSISKLWPLSPMEMGEGEKYLLQNIVGQVQGNIRTTRNADTVYVDAGHDRVWVTKPFPYEVPFLIDSQDKLASIIDLQSAYIKTTVAAIARYRDDTWIAGFFGNMLMGKDGATYVPFAAGNVVPVGIGATGPTGMNVDKLKRARRILTANFVDIDQEMYIAITAAQVEDLMGQVEVTSDDFKALGGRLTPDGKRIIGMLGFTFVELELSNPLLFNAALTLDPNGYRKNPFWTKDGMMTVPWEDLFTSIDPVPTKGMSTQVFARTTITATRTDNGRCGYILNLES